MSVTQYIGARYVPLLDGEWDKTKAYEPLTVVLYNGDSYTSRQYVPKGIDITNETYWAITANYSSQIDKYRKEVSDYKKEVETFDGRITSNANEIAKLEEKKYLAIIGDSFCADGDIPNLLGTRLNKNVINLAVRGSGFISTGITEEDSFLQQATKLVQNENFSKVDQIIIYGGVNDVQWQTASAMNDAVGNLCDYLKVNAPNVEINMFLFNTPPAWYQYLSGKLESCATVAVRRGITSVDSNAWLWFFNEPNMMNDDKLHPNEYGKTMIVGRILSSLNGSSTVKKDFIPTALNNVTIQNIKAEMINGVCYVNAALDTGSITADAFNDLLDVSSEDFGISIKFNRAASVCPFSEYNKAVMNGMIRTNGHLSFFNRSENTGTFPMGYSAIFPICYT